MSAEDASKSIWYKIWIKMKNILNAIGSYFYEINYPSLGKSFSEVLWMTFIAFLPLLINILITAIPTQDFLGAFKLKIIPGEILSYCLSFLAPSLYLLTKTHGTNYRLPFIKIFSLLTLLLYVSSIILYLIAKNKWVPSINLEHHDFDLYFKLSFIFLIITILLRVYSIYHGSFSNWTDIRKQQQDDFNKQFAAGINRS
jgi:hypothetical protein